MSCGLYVASTMYYAVLNDFVIEETPPEVERLTWFNRLVKSHVQFVSTDLLCLKTDLRLCEQRPTQSIHASVSSSALDATSGFEPVVDATLQGALTDPEAKDQEGNDLDLAANEDLGWDWAREWDNEWESLDRDTPLPNDTASSIVTSRATSPAPSDGDFSDDHNEISTESESVPVDINIDRIIHTDMNPNPSDRMNLTLDSYFGPKRQELQAYSNKKAVVQGVRGKDKETAKKRARSASTVAGPTNLPGSDHAASSHSKRPRTGQLTLDDVDVPSVGCSHTQTQTRLVNDSLKAGTFTLNDSKWKKFQTSIRKLDPRAVFPTVTSDDPSRVRLVTHFSCGRQLEMREPYNTVAFKSHVHGTKTQGPCKGPPKSKLSSGSSHPLMHYFSPSSSSSGLKEANRMLDRPCPGLRVTRFCAVGQYLSRSRAPGGGGPSWTEITKELYPSIRTYSQLSNNAKKNVRAIQRGRHRWLNHHDLERVVSAACLKTVRVAHTISDQQLPPCSACMEVLESKSFKTACSVPIPEDKHRKYTPHAHQEADARAVDVWSRTHGISALIEAFKKVS